MSFYNFRQNNSGGVHHGPAVNVVIEASSPEEANRIAVERAGLYFDGCESGRDCRCCGDRWYRAGLWSDEATAEVPEIEPWDQRWADGAKIPTQLVIRAEAKELTR